MPDVDTERRLAALERQVALLAARTRPNQNLSTGSNVQFLTMLSGTRGTWVPAFAGSTVAGVFTYTAATVGYYFVISNIICAFGVVGISAIGTPPTGNMSITGLPFPANATYAGSVLFGRISNFNYTALAMELTGIVNPGTQAMTLWESFDNGAVVAAPAANFTNAAVQFYFLAMYMGA